MHNKNNAYNLDWWHIKFNGTTETTKQLILTNSENIFPYRFQPIQRLQLNFMTDGIRKTLHYRRYYRSNASSSFSWWSEYFYLQFLTNKTLETWFYDCWHSSNSTYNTILWVITEKLSYIKSTIETTTWTTTTKIETTQILEYSSQTLQEIS